MFYGKLGTAGFLTAFIGLAASLTSAATQAIRHLLFFREPIQTINVISEAVLPLGLLGTLVGFVLLGMATLRARVLPHWCGAVLIGVFPVSFALSFISVGGLGGLAFGLVWLALGYVLWLHRGAEPRWRPPRRGVLWIVGIVAALAVVQPAVLLAGILEQQGTILVTIGVAAVLTVVIALARIGYRYQWTGFGEDVRPETDAHEVRRAKTLWDWLALLIIPVVLAVGGLWFSFAQDVRQQETEEQRARGAALQAYLDEIGDLLLDKKLQPENLDNEARTLARARTLTILERLNPGPSEEASPSGQPSLGSDRRRSVLQFLYESNLISKENVIVDLAGADLSDANLTGAVLRDANLANTNLIGADLTDADLWNANLRPRELPVPVGFAPQAEEPVVTQEQVNQAWGDESTELPDYLERPESWSMEGLRAKAETTKRTTKVP